MYLPKHFEETRIAVMHELLRAHPLGLLVTLSGGELQRVALGAALVLGSQNTIAGHWLAQRHRVRFAPELAPEFRWGTLAPSSPVVVSNCTTAKTSPCSGRWHWCCA